jgi:hypothetical protein
MLNGAIFEFNYEVGGKRVECGGISLKISYSNLFYTSLIEELFCVISMPIEETDVIEETFLCRSNPSYNK